MKTYIFIIRRICDITGAQQYVYNKMQYLESQGWRVLIFSSVYGNILISSFKKFEKNIHPQLFWSPAYFRKSEVEATLKQILNEIGDCRGSDCIVESDSFQRSVWAELIASRLGCRHLALFMQEKHSCSDKDRMDFLWFKYNRHELAGISSKSITQMLGTEGVARDDTRILACCTNVFDDCEDSYSALLDHTADYTLGSLGRLDKESAPKIVDGLCSYVNKYKQKRFNIVLIGGAKNAGREKEIKKKFSRCNNVHLVMTGNVYPIPLSFARRIDVFISTAGSARATYQAGLPTLFVHPQTVVPVGVIGLDYMLGEKSMFDANESMTIIESIDKALNERQNIKFSVGLGDDYTQKMHKEFERQLNFVNATSSNDYYDEGKLMKLTTGSTYGFIRPWLIGHLFGGKGFSMIWKLTRKN